MAPSSPKSYQKPKPFRETVPLMQFNKIEYRSVCYKRLPTAGACSPVMLPLSVQSKLKISSVCLQIGLYIGDAYRRMCGFQPGL
jgi:hypothetical protein